MDFPWSSPAPSLTGRYAPGPAAALASDRLIRDVLFLGTLLLVWFTTDPFPDLGDPRLLDSSTHGDFLNQAATILVTGALAAFALVKRSPLLGRVITLPLILTFVAFAASALHSAYPDVATRRLVLAAFTIFQASVLLLLPQGRQHFARLLAAAAIVILVACYFGVAFMPTRAIHQADDIGVLETAADIGPGDLTGDWRGLFAHKNGAGAAMVVLIFISIFVGRRLSRPLGAAIAICAAVFLYFSHAKSPLILLPIVLFLSYLVPRVRSRFLAFALVLGTPFLITLLSVGSVMFGPIKTLVSAVLPDPTFTGRDEIWLFALDHIAERPLFGFGFESFWGTPALVSNWNFHESWGYRASDAHNGYLNLGATTGLLGLGAVLWLIVVQPFADYRRCLAQGADRAMTTLFLQIWLFGLCLSSFEAELFRGGSALWFMMLVSMLGLRFLSIAETR
ncbi:MAG TPA: O-antigen ligase [Xanthobacteraceae bacterium]|nr:O-antigen ligase [Xanthobacteraceae bacterium]